MINIQQSGDFHEQYLNIVKDNQELLDLIADTIRWFEKNPEDSRIRNHTLYKRMEGKWAFSITDDIRIVYEWLGTNTVRFLAIGTHPQVYNRKNLKE